MKRYSFCIFLSVLAIGSLLPGCTDETEYLSERCQLPATVVDLGDGCGYGFQLSDGTKLQHVWEFMYCGTPPLPKEVTEHPLYNFQFVPGKQVLIGFEETDRESNCNVAKPVNITCLEEVSGGEE